MRSAKCPKKANSSLFGFTEGKFGATPSNGNRESSIISRTPTTVFVRTGQIKASLGETPKTNRDSLPNERI